MLYSWSGSGDANAGAQFRFSRKWGSGKVNSGAQLPFSFFSASGLSAWKSATIFRVGHLTSIDPLWKIYHRPAQRLVSSVILDIVRFPIDVSHRQSACFLVSTQMVLSSYMKRRGENGRQEWVFLSLVEAWTVFIPNYLIIVRVSLCDIHIHPHTDTHTHTFGSERHRNSPVQ